MTREAFRQFVQEKIIILDGATGSNLYKRGMPYGVCPELWVCENREVMMQLQKEYVESGSNIIYAPTFSGNRIKLKEYGLEGRIEELNRELVAISKEAADEKALVAGDITMTGAQLEPMGDLTFDELVDVYREQIQILAEAGVDLLVIETMMSLQETRAAVIAAKEVCELPIMATLSFNENGKTLYGVSAKSAVVVLQGMGVDAIGLNCSLGPDKVCNIVKEMKQYATVPVIAKPNAGMPKLLEDGTTAYDMEAEEFAVHMRELKNNGAQIIGSCCGSTPEFIDKIAKALAAEKAEKIPTRANKVYLASEREVFVFEQGQQLEIGIDIDFSKDDELVGEYQDDIFDTAVDLAFDMEDADMIRIATCTEGVNEAEAILAVAEEVARNVSVPLLIASDSPKVVEFVVKHYSGIMAIQLNHNLKEWEGEIKSIARSYQVPLVTIDNEIIYC